MHTPVVDRLTLLLAGADTTLASEVSALLATLPPHTIHHADYQLYPLSFRETILLKYGETNQLTILFEEFNFYLQHGGYLHAINEIAMQGKISDKTFTSYADWVLERVIQRGKQERYLREILNATLKHYNEQVSWNFLAQELTIDHPKTIGDYFLLLEEMGIVFVQYALLETSLSAAPKKARKLMFTDPFLYHAMHAKLTASKTIMKHNYPNC